MEQTIYDKAIEAVKAGAKFKIDLVNRSFSIGKKYLIDKGKYEGKLIDNDGFSISTLEALYQVYKHSRPSERSERKQKFYFRALRTDELEEDDMLYGTDREVAQIELELYLLCWILSGLFVWDEETMGRWFWQSDNDKDLVILRSWIDNNNTDK